MEVLSEKIVQYADRAGLLEDTQRSVLKFGIESSLEIGTNILVSLLLLYKLNMIPEGIFFFCIFIPVRMYSGGYHTDTYFRCLIFSVLSLFCVMQLSLRLHVALWLVFVFISLQIVTIWMIAPVINTARPVSNREYQTFTGKLRRTLVIVEITAGMSVALGSRRLTNIIMFCLLLILITLLAGKIKYRDYQMGTGHF